MPGLTKTGAIAFALLALASCQSIAPETEPTISNAQNASPVSVERTALFTSAKALRDFCTEHMPDVDATKAALREAGFKQQLWERGITLHYEDDNDAILALVDTPNLPSCGLIVRRMTVDEATTLIEPWLSAYDATPVPESRISNRAVSNSWDGNDNGKAVELNILTEFVARFRIRGAVITASWL